MDGQTTLHVELEDSDLDPYLDRGYRSVSQRVVIPGFRKGKAPRRIVEGFMGRESLLTEVLENLVSEVTDRAIKEQDLNAVGLPKIDDLELDPVQFTATVPLRPDVQLGDYRSIRIDYQQDEITEQDVSDRIDEIRESLGTWEPVERAPQLGDLITIDFSGSAGDDHTWDREDTTFYMNQDGTFPVPGFSEKLVGAEVGNTLEFSVDLPEDFEVASIAGKEATFSVTVKDVKGRALPELNDEFAQSLPDGFEDLNALRTAVEEVLTQSTENQTDQRYEADVIEALLAEAEIQIPPILLEREADHIVGDQLNFLERANIRRDDYLRSIGSTEEEVRQQAEEEADQRLRRNFAIGEVTDLEGVEASDEEIDERFNEVFAGRRIRRQERREGRSSVERILKYEKTVSLLVEIAKGEHKSTDTRNDSDDNGSGDPEGGETEDDSQA